MYHVKQMNKNLSLKIILAACPSAYINWVKIPLVIYNDENCIE